mmetsp:Transcript_18697/g.28638  ORF Transcript_18697/g.28638 Transcript_18697/m.28638 type:complete len:99 (+) Transcript_18697:341-637(+)
MSVWRWDKKNPELRFPLKEQLSVFKLSKAPKEVTTSQLCVGASKSGQLNVWSATDGKLLAEIPSAHYLDITDLDISPENSDIIATGGKDQRVKLWLTH